MIKTLALISLATLGAGSAPMGVVAQGTTAPKPVLLKRIYKLGEKQAYTFEMTMAAAEPGSEFKISGEYLTTINKVSTNGQADIGFESTKLKMTFGAEEQDAPEMPKPVTLTFDEFGVPTKMDLGDEANPAIGALVVGFLPNKSVALGASYEIKWSSSDGYKMDGKGTLIATGMLFEEHVAKIQFEAKTVEKDGGEGAISGTVYTNTDTGKLVKAEATAEFENDGEKSTGKLVIAKVRQK